VLFLSRNELQASCSSKSVDHFDVGHVSLLFFGRCEVVVYSISCSLESRSVILINLSQSSNGCLFQFAEVGEDFVSLCLAVDVSAVGPSRDATAPELDGEVILLLLL
jgi:hypothetical protein